MRTRDDGGLAFPIEEPAGGGCGPKTHFGMTLRDYFAAKAMQSLIPISLDPNSAVMQEFERIFDAHGMECPASDDVVSAIAFQWADAMLCRRAA